MGGQKSGGAGVRVLLGSLALQRIRDRARRPDHGQADVVFARGTVTRAERDTQCRRQRAVARLHRGREDMDTWAGFALVLGVARPANAGKLGAQLLRIGAGSKVGMLTSDFAVRVGGNLTAGCNERMIQ